MAFVTCLVESNQEIWIHVIELELGRRVSNLIVQHVSLLGHGLCVV